MFVLVLIVFLLIGGLVAFIAVKNPTPLVHLDLFSWHTPDLPFGVWLVVAFLCGAVALYLISMLSALGDRSRMKVLRKRVLALEEQVTALGQTGPAFAGQRADGGLSSADTVPVTPMPPGVMSTPQPEGRVPSAPLSQLQNFHQ